LLWAGAQAAVAGAAVVQVRVDLEPAHRSLSQQAPNTQLRSALVVLAVLAALLA
jgi:hypothetical protein